MCRAEEHQCGACWGSSAGGNEGTGAEEGRKLGNRASGKFSVLKEVSDGEAEVTTQEEFADMPRRKFAWKRGGQGSRAVSRIIRQWLREWRLIRGQLVWLARRVRPTG